MSTGLRQLGCTSLFFWSDSRFEEPNVFLGLISQDRVQWQEYQRGKKQACCVSSFDALKANGAGHTEGLCGEDKATLISDSCRDTESISGLVEVYLA